ncbi:sigma-70 family RNA polymerase sigma factor [Streptomyces resistomycificus]|uniref:RNA polymerase subunit sigma-70 n=1 Tax=Streptomyces resistomycificus TaxID=67356 RepID=A0A0L8LEB5_9ACTN|nr:sigma-70 family RNA polymerase sigma factor [Streptomyces resistomycificus]KOG36467.1 hypothetical protein ADK37_13815 [Streptomyces resistomycificus]
MTDGPGPATVPAQASATVRYTRIFEEQQPRLVAYARSLTRNSWTAEDLVAEAHFRVWRRLSAGHEIDNVPAYLMTTVRHLAGAVATATRETPQDPQTAAERSGPADSLAGDPAEQVSSVDLLTRVLGQLPERWVEALWLAEAEGQSLEVVGQRIGAKQGATAVLLHRAREGMRQAFLRVQTGAPDDPACEVHWVRMPAYVRGNATARQSERLLGHIDTCDDCRHRLAILMRANDRLPALVGPALLVFALGGTGKYVLSLAAASTGAATALGGSGGAAGSGGAGFLDATRQAVTTGGGAKVPAAVAAGAAAVTATALALVLALGAGDPSTTTPDRKPLAQAPAARPSKGTAPVGDAPKGLEGSAGSEDRGKVERAWVDGGGMVVVAKDTVDAGDSTVAPVAPVGRTAEEPVGDAPVGGTPVGGAPVVAGPVDEGPVDEEPVNDGPVNDGPVDEGPTDEPPPQEGPGPEDGGSTPAPADPVEADPNPPVQENPPGETPEPEAPEVQEPPSEEPPSEEPPSEAPGQGAPETEAPPTPSPEPTPAPTPTPTPTPTPEPTPTPTPVQNPSDPAEHTDPPSPNPGAGCGDGSEEEARLEY